jgi:hypothetical protein
MMTPAVLFVGLLAGQAVSSVPGPARFDYSTVGARAEEQARNRLRYTMHGIASG